MNTIKSQLGMMHEIFAEIKRMQQEIVDGNFRDQAGQGWKTLGKEKSVFVRDGDKVQDIVVFEFKVEAGLDGTLLVELGQRGDEEIIPLPKLLNKEQQCRLFGSSAMLYKDDVQPLLDDLMQRLDQAWPQDGYDLKAPSQLEVFGLFDWPSEWQLQVKRVEVLALGRSEEGWMQLETSEGPRLFSEAVVCRYELIRQALAGLSEYHQLGLQEQQSLSL